MTLSCHVVHPLSVSIVTPNASYREDTTVMTSFWLNNSSSINYTPDSKITAKIIITNMSTGEAIKSITKSNLIVPANDKNLYWVKWTVPTGFNSTKVLIDVVLFENGKQIYADSLSRKTTQYFVYSTPDTQYERSAPEGFSVSATPSETTQIGSWWQYSYSNGTYTKNNYAVALSSSQNISPAEGNSSYTDNSGNYVMKSGYGFSVSASGIIVSVEGYTSIVSSMYTAPQYVTALFPEFGYTLASTKCRTLISSSSKYVFRTNGDYGNVHFTPLYYPDGDYIVQIKYSDIWTPAGMITSIQNTNTIKISGSAYDDWYITH